MKEKGPTATIYAVQMLHAGESTNRGLVCAHMHSIARTQKILTFMSYTGECRPQKNSTSMHHPRIRNVTISMAGFKKKVTYAKISPKMVNPRDIAGERRRRRITTITIVTAIPKSVRLHVTFDISFIITITIIVSTAFLCNGQ